MKNPILTLLICFVLQTAMSQSPLMQHYQQSKAAYEQKNYNQFLFHLQKADSISPNHPTITYNLAAAYSLTGDKTKAIELVKRAVLMNTRLMPLDDADFATIIETDEFEPVTELYYELQKPIANSELAFEVDDIDLHPESIAYNPIDNTFLISSVHKNKIVEYSLATSEVKDWKQTSEDGLWAVMGMKVDTERNSLWVCTVATKEMQDYDSTLEGKTAVLQFDLKSKKLLNRYELEGGHWFGDLVIHTNGDVYITDSMKPIIYRVSKGKLEVYYDLTNELYNLQGICFNPMRNIMYIADYKLGLYSHILNTRSVKKVSHPDDMSSKGVDGLYFHHGNLITIQNGVKPFRITELTLNKGGNLIQSFEYIDRGRPELGEPTLGVIEGDELYYIANSPWGAYDKEGNFSTEGLKSNIILKSKLK